MAQRWIILGVLFLARLSMAFQFQSTGALSPYLMGQYALGLAEIGLLIGLYLGPGVIVALPGGAIAARIGDKRIVALSLVMMLVGGAITLVAPSWGWLLNGRVVAGIGGVIINVVMTKMLVDWFTGHEISTALALFINSWPIGIALSLLVLPGLAAVAGLQIATLATLALVLLGLTGVLLGYRTPPQQGAVNSAPAEGAALPWRGLTLAAGIWALYNAALAIVFSFGPTVLIDAGWAVKSASSITSLFMAVLALTLPFGGFFADRTGRRDLVIMVSFVGYVLLLPLILFVSGPAAILVLVAVAGLFGLAGGPIMSLPSLVLPPQARAYGMGVFFTIYYAVMLLVPPLAGAGADATGNPGTVIWIGVGMIVACILLLLAFQAEDPSRTTESPAR